jgi:hypothetical protein
MLREARRAVLSVTRFDGQLTRDLQAWGYNLVARTAAKETPAPPAQAPAA